MLKVGASFVYLFVSFSFLISFANRLDIDQAQQNVRHGLDPIFVTPRWYSWIIGSKKDDSEKILSDNNKEYENSQGVQS